MNAPGYSERPFWHTGYRRGLGVLNIAKYYLATQTVQLSLLHATFHTPLWVLLELPNCAPIAMPTLLWIPHNLCPSTLSPLMHHSLQVWDSVWYSAWLMSPFLPLLPISNNSLFPPGLDQPRAFSWWVTNGFSHVRHFLTTRPLPAWASLRETHDAPEEELFCDLQLQHWLTSLRTTATYPFQKTTFKHICLHSPGSPGLISALYASLNNCSSDTSLTYVA